MLKRFHVALILAVVLTLPLLQMPKAYSAEMSAPEKALAIFNDLVCLDVVAYNINLDLHNQDLFFETLPQEHVKFTLESNESKLELHCNFVNEKLQSIDMFVLDGLPQMTQPATNVLDMAKGFLDRYQSYSGASYIEEMRSMLDMVDANENVTKTSGNTKLEVTVTQNYTSFRWKYTVNGLEAIFKRVSLFFEDGFLAYFMDNWDLYKIGSSHISLSEEEAIEIAMNAAKNYSWNVSMGGDKPPVTVTEFNIVGVNKTMLTLGNGIWKNEARDGDPLTLYPRWRIYLYFDKLYPGNVYGLDVGIWADTGEVHDIRAMISGLGPPPEDSTTEPPPDDSTGKTGLDPTPFIIAVPIVLAIILGAVFYKRKKIVNRQTQSTNISH